VVRALERRGYEAIIISRSAQPKKNWTNASDEAKKKLKRVTWKDIEADGLPSGTVGVVNTAGQNVLDPLRRWSDKLQKELYESRCDE